jgi:hypothetical protein
VNHSGKCASTRSTRRPKTGRRRRDDGRYASFPSRAARQRIRPGRGARAGCRACAGSVCSTTASCCSATGSEQWRSTPL